MSINYRVLHIASVTVLGGLLCFSSSAYADTIYLKNGTIIQGAVKSEDENTILIEIGDAWRKIDKSNIESMNKDTVPAERQAETNVQSQQSSTATPRPVTDLRLKFGSAAQADKLTENGRSATLSGEVSSNFQIEVNMGFYGQSTVGYILSAGLFSRTHSGNNPIKPQNKVEYDAAGLSLGAGIGIKTSDHLHFEGKIELGMGAGNGKITAPGYVGGTSEKGGYGSVSLILGAYYTVSKQSFQIGFELGTQSFSGEFKYAGIYNEKVEGSSSTANLVVGMRF
jgi:hypothetical protein